MSDREALRLDFLARAGLADATRQPLPGDASTRRYERLITPSGLTLMLMDQAPAAESPPADPSWTAEQRLAAGWNATARLSAGRIDAFAAVAGRLRAIGLSAPEVAALDVPAGLAVLEDLGDDLFARAIEQGAADEAPLYLAAVEALARLHEAEPPNPLAADGVEWPLQAYDRVALQAGADLFPQWYPQFDPRMALDADALPRWREAWAPVCDIAEGGARFMAHRDYHAENLIWLPGRAGVARVGMIDFQDAVLAHRSWDLHSLLMDVRREVAPSTRDACIARYRALTGEGPELVEAYASLGAMNLTRILGVFARLVVRDGKPRYRRFMPRAWSLLRPFIEREGPPAVRDWFRRYAPVEVRG